MKKSSAVKLIIILLVIGVIGIILIGLGSNWIGYNIFQEIKDPEIENFSASDHVQKLSNNILKNEVYSLDFTAHAGKIEIKKGTEFSVQSNDTDFVSTDFEDGVLEIEINNNHIFLPRKHIYVEVTIPENIVFETVDLKTAAGKIEANDLNTKNLSVDVSAGTIKMQNLCVQNKSDFLVQAGILDVDGNFSSHNTVQVNAGSANFKVSNSEPYGYAIQSSIGSVSINGQKYTGISENKTIHENAPVFFNLNCNAGNIDVSFPR